MTDELQVARLRAAGAIVLGKTNVPEFTLEGYAIGAQLAAGFGAPTIPC